MPRISGLFQYVRQRFTREGTQFAVINENVPGKSPSLFFRIKEAGGEPNPFADRGFTWSSTPRQYPHLRIDLHYHSSISDLPGRRNLSYCHGTEYFSRDKEIIQIHYYFDAFGNFTHAHTQFIPSKERVQLSDSELDILEQRANIYGAKVKDLMKQKAIDFSELTDSIEKKHLEILQKLQGNFDKRQLLIEVDELIALIEQKNSFEDLRHVSAAPKFLIRSLQALRARINNDEIAEVSSTTPVAERDKEPESAAVDTTVSASLPTKAKVKAKDIKKAIAVQIDAEIARCEQSIKKLTLLVKDHTSVEKTNVVEYLKLLDTTRIDLLGLTFLSRANKHQVTKIAKLYADAQSLPSAIKLLEDAVLKGDLELVKALFPFCEDLVTNRFYFDLFMNWVMGGADQELSTKKEQIFDFFSENCPVFNNFIQKSPEMFIVIENNLQVNFAFFAYNHKNQSMFAALFRYGLDPNAPMCNLDKLFAPFTVIAKLNPSDTGFYLETLNRHGYSLDFKQPYEDGQIINPKSAIKTPNLPASHKHKLKSSMAKFAELAATFEMPANFGTATVVSLRTHKAPLYPLREFCLETQDFYSYPHLFAFLVDRSKIIDLLAVAGYFICGSTGVTLIPNINARSVECCSLNDVHGLAAQLKQTAGDNWSIIFASAIPDLDYCGTKLITVLKSKLPESEAATAALMQELEQNAKELTRNKQFQQASLLYLAQFILYTQRPGIINAKSKQKYAHTLYWAAFTLERHAEQLAEKHKSDVAPELLAKELFAIHTRASKIYILLTILAYNDPNDELYKTGFVQTSVANLYKLCETKIEPSLRASFKMVVDKEVAKKPANGLGPRPGI